MLCNNNNLKPNQKQQQRKKQTTKEEKNVCVRVTKIFTLNTSLLIALEWYAVFVWMGIKNHKEENAMKPKKLNANFINIISSISIIIISSSSSSSSPKSTLLHTKISLSVSRVLVCFVFIICVLK